MTTDGGLDRWGSDGPVVWHSETSDLGYWGKDGIFSDYQVASFVLLAAIPKAH